MKIGIIPINIGVQAGEQIIQIAQLAESLRYESGRILDDAFSGAGWMSLWSEGLALVDELVSDNFEQCQIIYTAK